MKTRNGFVSNSSSSSFIIGEFMEPLLAKAYEAVSGKASLPIKEVAIQMLRASDRESHIKWLAKLPDNIQYIVFNSCNYESEIMDMGHGVLVLTCNNEYDSWETALTTIERTYDMGYKYIEDSDIYEELVYKNPLYDYSSGGIIFKELDEECPIYTHFDFVAVAKEKGPAAYISEQGVILYEGEKRICIK